MTDITLGGASSAGFMNSNIISEIEVNNIKNSNESFINKVFDFLSDSILGTHRDEAKQAIRDLVGMNGEDVPYDKIMTTFDKLINCTKAPEEGTSNFASGQDQSLYLGELKFNGHVLDTTADGIILKLTYQDVGNGNYRVSLMDGDGLSNQTVAAEPIRPKSVEVEVLTAPTSANSNKSSVSDIETDTEENEVTPGGPLSSSSSVFLPQSSLQRLLSQQQVETDERDPEQVGFSSDGIDSDIGDSNSPKSVSLQQLNFQYGDAEDESEDEPPRQVPHQRG